MAKPIPSGNLQSFFVSAAQILVDGVDQGFVSKVSIKVKDEVTDVKTDQLGKTVANRFYVGQSVSVEMMIDELTAARLKESYPFGSLVTTGPAQKISWGQSIGGNYVALAKQLTIKPTSDDTGDTSRNYTFFLAVPVGDSDVKESPDGKAEIKTVFHVYPDLTQQDGNWFGFFGDPTAGSLVYATFTAAVPGGGNVGGGSLGAIVVNNTYTETETWTATCIATAVNSGIFAIAGSVTGARGNATVGSTYFSNSITPANSEVQFLISDGTPDFAVGDTFTLTTTAKMYV